jgi:Tfp pilus assembly protein PilN
MLYLNFDHEDIRIRNTGMARLRLLWIGTFCLSLLLILCWVGILYVSSNGTHMGNDPDNGEIALQQSIAELDARRAELRAHEIRQEQLARVVQIRWNIVAVLEALPFLLPEELSLSEVSVQDQTIRFRGIAGEGRAIQVLIERLRRVFGSSECAVESVRRAHERDRWRDEFAIAIRISSHS